MSKFLKKILWTTDFSDESRESFEYAASFAQSFGSDLIALHVAPDFSPALYDMASVIRGEIAERVDDFKKKATEKLDQIQKNHNIPFKKIIKVGNAAKKIIETSEEEGVDLIVIGRKGMSAVEKLFIGSVANQVIRNASVPLLLTKKNKENPRFNKFLVPTDFSAQEDKERDMAFKLAEGFKAQLTLLHVLELHDYEFSPSVLKEMFNTVLDRLKNRKTRGKEKVKVEEDVTRAVNAALGIVDYTETHGYDMIVMSTCVHSKLERFFLGSTTEKVVSYSRIPVFAIPPSYSLK